jgi:hypothetical protein
MTSFQTIFSNKKPIIAMIHIFEGELSSQIDRAIEDTQRLNPFVDGLIVENYDCGYVDRNLASQKMARTLVIITNAVMKKATIPVGVNVLPNDYEKAFWVCEETGAKFIQLDHVTGQFIGRRSVDPKHLAQVHSLHQDVILLGGIHPKYYELVDTNTPIAESAITAKTLANAIVVTGDFTGGETNLNDILTVRTTIGNHPIIIGSGVNTKNIATQLSVADGAIVGTALKKGGVQPGEHIDIELVKRLIDEVTKLR